MAAFRQALISLAAAGCWLSLAGLCCLEDFSGVFLPGSCLWRVRNQPQHVTSSQCQSLYLEP